MLQQRKPSTIELLEKLDKVLIVLSMLKIDLIYVFNKSANKIKQIGWHHTLFNIFLYLI